MEIVRTISQKDLSWTLSRSDFHEKDYISLYFKGTNPDYFKENGFVGLSVKLFLHQILNFKIYIRKNNGIQEVSPKLPVLRGSILAEAVVSGYQTKNQKSRLITSFNLLTNGDGKKSLEVKRYARDIIPAVFRVILIFFLNLFTIS